MYGQFLKTIERTDTENPVLAGRQFNFWVQKWISKKNHFFLLNYYLQVIHGLMMGQLRHPPSQTMKAFHAVSKLLSIPPLLDLCGIY